VTLAYSDLKNVLKKGSGYIHSYSCTKNCNTSDTFLHVSALLGCRHEGVLMLTEAAPLNWSSVQKTVITSFN
jgi:hypothetical protein